MLATIFLLCYDLVQKHLSLSPYYQETMSFILMGPNFNRGRAIAVKKKSTKKRKCIRLYFKNTIPSKGYLILIALNLLRSKGQSMFRFRLLSLKFFVFPPAFSSFCSVILILSSSKPIPRIREYIVGFAINASARRNTSMSAKCPHVLGENFEGRRGKCSSVY